VGAGVGAVVGAALGIAGALIPQGGFAGGAAAAVITLVAHTASGTNVGGAIQVTTDTAGGAVGDNAVAGTAVSAAGTAASEATLAAAGDVGAAAAEGGVAGAAGAVTSAVTGRLLHAALHAAGCP
jgi:hypothetical protein